MRPTFAVAILLFASVLAGCAQVDKPPVAAGETTPGCPKVEGRDTETPILTIETNFGTITAELCAALAPRTVAHFTNLSRTGTYAGAEFYRVVGPSDDWPNGFVIQGGLQAGATSVPTVADEFHPLLRHDRAGVLSVAHRGPHTGSSEFFVTLDKTPHLDDRHAVFGFVTKGIEVVREIGDVEVDEDAPKVDVKITRMSVATDPAPPADASAVRAYAPVPRRATEPDRGVQWAVVGANAGNAVDRLRATLEAPAGWTTAVDVAEQRVAAGSGAVFLVRTLPPAGTNGTFNLTAVVSSVAAPNQTVRVPLVLDVGPLGEEVDEGQRVLAHYAGFLEDGRVFDTSFEEVAQNASIAKLGTVFQPGARGTPFPFTVGTGVIAGFTNLAKDAKAGETRVGRIPAAQAYGDGLSRPSVYEQALAGKTLVFELLIVKKCGSATGAC